MRLNGDFYSIESRMEGLPQGQSGFNVILNPDHLIYKAHFPGQPVTPGVCILQMIQELLSEEMGIPLFINKIKNAKFTIRNYLAGGYSDLHIKKANDGVFDVWITNVLEPYNDWKEEAQMAPSI